MEPKDSLSYIREPVTGPYLEPDESNLITYDFNIYFDTILKFTLKCFYSVSSFHIYRLKLYMYYSSLPCVLFALLISSSIWQSKQWELKVTKYEAPRRVSVSLLLSPSWTSEFFSAPCSKRKLCSCPKAKSFRVGGGAVTTQLLVVPNISGREISRKASKSQVMWHSYSTVW
jgi:hypothetical protein